MQSDATRSARFGYSTSTGSQFDNVAGDLVSFAAGKTKRVAFDLNVAAVTSSSGALSIQPFYNSTMLGSQQFEMTK